MVEEFIVVPKVVKFEFLINIQTSRCVHCRQKSVTKGLFPLVLLIHLYDRRSVRRKKSFF